MNESFNNSHLQTATCTPTVTSVPVHRSESIQQNKSCNAQKKAQAKTRAACVSNQHKVGALRESETTQPSGASPFVPVVGARVAVDAAEEALDGLATPGPLLHGALVHLASQPVNEGKLAHLQKLQLKEKHQSRSTSARVKPGNTKSILQNLSPGALITYGVFVVSQQPRLQHCLQPCLQPFLQSHNCFFFQNKRQTTRNLRCA